MTPIVKEKFMQRKKILNRFGRTWGTAPSSFRRVFVRNIGAAPTLYSTQKPCGMTSVGTGFTLIELLVVVLIIGILAAVAVPQYQVAIDKTRAKTALLIMRHIRDAEELYKLANGNYTMDFTELNLDLPVKSINANKDTITLTDGKNFNLSNGGTYLHITAGWSGGPVALYWAIKASTMLCYPRGTARGRKLCKSLGCASADGQYCYFTAAMH